ncbi:ABC transporter permease [Nocardiopsis sp. HUAS JQ3]|uniref:ABC transporter permease n=1 Tax=Nocardiopsis sp. HUAS JQ3 TaxID=3061629 RepID=UPI0023A9CBE3|nr:ABC transporter permease [Nocardiopsis sp. HUAS JQ3]WDZ90876.1 ABC transporter permease [Nocardiopsis sp. HUAS JQ3]
MTATRRRPLPTSPFGLGHDLRTVRVVLKRDLFRFVHDVSRGVAMLLQSVMWLFVIGVGFGSLIPRGEDDLPLTAVMFPGVVVMTVMGTAVSSAATIVTDREVGFLRGMLVAPAKRSALILGKILSGAVLATLQASIILAVAGLAGVPYAPGLMLTLFGLTFLVALTASAVGVLIAISVRGSEAFMGMAQLVISPLVLLSGAMFPIGNLPSWLTAITLVNPVTYVVDPMRQAVFAHLDTSPETEALFNPGITWFGWQIPWTAEVALVAGVGALLVWLTVVRFGDSE